MYIKTMERTIFKLSKMIVLSSMRNDQSPKRNDQSWNASYWP